MVFIDIFFLIMLAILWGQLKRSVQPILEALAILWRHIKCRMHRHAH